MSGRALGSRASALDPRVLDIITCKVTRHHVMETDAAYRLRQGAYKHRLVWRCRRCGTVRHDLLDWKGDVLSRQYVYPDGYKEVDAIPISELRLALVNLRRSHE